MVHVGKAEIPITNPSKSDLVGGGVLMEDDRGKQGAKEYQTCTPAWSH